MAEKKADAAGGDGNAKKPATGEKWQPGQNVPRPTSLSMHRDVIVHRAKSSNSQTEKGALNEICSALAAKGVTATAAEVKAFLAQIGQEIRLKADRPKVRSDLV